MLLYVIFFIFMIGVLAYLSSPSFKGKVGEGMVIEQAKRYLGEEYVMLNNCTIPDEKNGTTQIDHILLSPYGVLL